MTTDTTEPEATARHRLEKVLAHAMVDLAGELRLIDSIDVLCEQANGRTGNIADMVESAAELFFRHGTIVSGHQENTASGSPRAGPVNFNLVFRSTGVEARFNLCLAEGHTEISLFGLHCQPPAHGQGTKLSRLRHALNTARLEQPLDLLREAHAAPTGQCSGSSSK
jgi:hypothetical protein